jgi:hypothetical protein
METIGIAAKQNEIVVVAERAEARRGLANAVSFKGECAGDARCCN